MVLTANSILVPDPITPTMSEKKLSRAMRIAPTIVAK